MTLKDLHGAVGLWSEINELNEKLEKAQSEKSRLTASVINFCIFNQRFFHIQTSLSESAMTRQLI